MPSTFVDSLVNDPAVEALRADFVLSHGTLNAVADDFAQAMRDGLAGRPSSLRMLPSFLEPPTGREHGAVLAIDFGGTHVRVLLVTLRGRGSELVVQQQAYPLVDAGAGYDHMSARADATTLFDFIAAKVAVATLPGSELRLGLTFSFPCAQHARDRATLIRWTKEFATRGVEGQDVGELLRAALRRAGLPGIRPVVILNDTVGTLLSASYQHAHVDMGAICGTGHNTCYLEPLHPLTDKPMLVNLESGNFDVVPVTRFDAQLDASSEQPGTQRLEKLVAGKYLGELLKLVVLELQQCGAVRFVGTSVLGRVRGEAQIISDLLAADSAGAAASVLRGRLGVQVDDPLSLQRIRTAAQLLADRSAGLVAATVVGVARYLTSRGHSSRGHSSQGAPRVVAIDGSIYAKLPGYATQLQLTLDLLTPAPGAIVALRAKDGSGIGAAVAAATIT